MYGIINLNKPAGYTSMDCCAVIRKLCGEKKVGHTGTLDPNATGVLPVCIGKATRLIEYMDTFPKTYLCGCRLGFSTDTHDIWGNPDEAVFDGLFPSKEAVEEALISFKGEILQRPPAYSAVKVAGKRLYSYAREGKKVESDPRPVIIDSIELIEYDETGGELTFKMSCSRGTYLRSVCHELGEKLACGGTMSSLIRTSSCGFELKDSVSLDTLRGDGVEGHLLPIERAVSAMPRIVLGDDEKRLFLNGTKGFFLDPGAPEGTVFAVFSGGELLGTSVVKPDGEFKILKVLA